MDIATLGLEVRSDGVVVASDRLKKFGQDAGRAERATDGMSRAFRALAPLLAAVTAALGVSALVRYADAWSDMQSKVGAAIKDMEAAPVLMRRMVDIANASYSPLQQTVEIYSRNVGVLRDLGLNASKAADFTEALNHSLVITATRGERAASVQNALSKAMAVGKLQGDGLETVLANGGRVAELLAGQLGTTISGLRGMASQGKITGQVIADALIGNLEKVRAEAAEMPATIGDAFVRIQNNLTAFFGILDKTWGISGKVSETMLAMADAILANVDGFARFGNILGSIVGPALDFIASSFAHLAPLIAIVAAGFVGIAGQAVISAFLGLAAAVAGPVVAAFAALDAVLLANPLLGWIGAIAAVVTAIFMFRDKIKEAVGIDVVEVFRVGGNAIFGAMVGAVKAVQAAWEVFPEFMGGLGARAWNAFLENFEGPAVSWTNPFTGAKFDLINLNLSGFKKDPSPGQQNALDAVTGAFQSAQNTDDVGQISTSLGDLWTNAEGAGGAIGALLDTLDDGGAGGGGGRLTAANDNFKAYSQMLSDVAPLLQAANDPLIELQSNMDKLGALLNAGQISWEQYGEAVNKANLLAASSVLGSVGQITSILSGAFQDNKLLAAASAAINTAEGVTKALAQGGMFAWPTAIAIGAAGAAQIASIMSAKPGSASVASVGSAPTTAAPAPQQSTAINLTVKGSGMVSVDDFAQQLTKSIADGGHQSLINVIRAA